MADVLTQWIEAYCAGYKMPDYFREEATNYFNRVYKICQNHPELLNILKTNETILRVYSFNYGKNTLLYFDEMYYSFSNDIDGIKNVVDFDKNLKTDIFIVEAKPRDAINLTELLNTIYENYQSRFLCENEVISKLYKDDILNIYFIKNCSELELYKSKGIKIDLKDLNLSCEKIAKKYNIKNFL